MGIMEEKVRLRAGMNLLGCASFHAKAQNFTPRRKGTLKPLRPLCVLGVKFAPLRETAFAFLGLWRGWLVSSAFPVED
jgi:hypothetical protein